MKQAADLRCGGRIGVIVVGFVTGPSTEFVAVELMRFEFDKQREHDKKDASRGDRVVRRSETVTPAWAQSGPGR